MNPGSTDPETPTPPTTETDPRFPSGPWTGFFLQPGTPERHWMELDLLFREGRMTGTGRDRVGPFVIAGRYHLDDGRAFWTKTYIRRHSIEYSGYNEGKGIWGTWEYLSNWRGGFQIWPVAMGDPTQQRLAAVAPAPVDPDASEPTAPVEAPPVEAPAERELQPVGSRRLRLAISADRWTLVASIDGSPSRL